MVTSSPTTAGAYGRSSAASVTQSWSIAPVGEANGDIPVRTTGNEPGRRGRALGTPRMIEPGSVILPPSVGRNGLGLPFRVAGSEPRGEASGTVRLRATCWAYASPPGSAV